MPLVFKSILQDIKKQISTSNYTVPYTTEKISTESIKSHTLTSVNLFTSPSGSKGFNYQSGDEA